MFLDISGLLFIRNLMIKYIIMGKIVMNTEEVWIDESGIKSLIICPTHDEDPSKIDEMSKRGWERVKNPDGFNFDVPFCLKNKGDMKNYFIKINVPETILFPANRHEDVMGKTQIVIKEKCTFQNISVPWGGRSTGSRYGRVICSRGFNPKS